MFLHRVFEGDEDKPLHEMVLWFDSKEKTWSVWGTQDIETHVCLSFTCSFAFVVSYPAVKQKHMQPAAVSYESAMQLLKKHLQPSFAFVVSYPAIKQGLRFRLDCKACGSGQHGRPRAGFM